MGDPRLLSLAETLGPPLLRLLGSTWRVRVLPEGVEEERGARGQRVIFSFWHGRMLVPAYTHRFRKIAILVSIHHDGEIIARVIRRLGFVAARGSTTRRGGAGLVHLLKLARSGHDLAFTPDGPRGPRYRVQRGVVYAASRTGLPVVPAAVEASPAWVLGSWDEFTIPKPGARAVILQGDPLPVPPDLDEAGIEEHRRELEARMLRLTARAREMVKPPAPGSGKEDGRSS